MKHLKRWTLWSLLRSDILDHASPWARQILESREMLNNLNLRVSDRLSAALAGVSVLLLALAAGKHLFVEKPLALSLEECDRLIEAARRDSLRATVGFNLRRHRLVREAREVIRRGELGAVKLVRTVIASGVRRQAEYPDWLRSRETGGGALFELGVHHFDLARFLLGSAPDEVFAAYGEGDETACVTARMSCGAAACLSLLREHGAEPRG